MTEILLVQGVGPLWSVRQKLWEWKEEEKTASDPAETYAVVRSANKSNAQNLTEGSQEQQII